MKNNARVIYRDLIGMEISADFRRRLMQKTGWNISTAEAVDFEYRCFLLLCAVSDMTLTPPEAVDIAWHEHILHTRHYQDILPRIIGKRLHHDPGIEGDEEKHRIQYKNTWSLYRRIFGRDPTEIVWPRPQHRITDIFRRKDANREDLDLAALWVIASADSPAYACAPTTAASHDGSSSAGNLPDTGSDTSSCGSSCGGGCGGD